MGVRHVPAAHRVRARPHCSPRPLRRGSLVSSASSSCPASRSSACACGWTRFPLALGTGLAVVIVFVGGRSRARASRPSSTSSSDEKGRPGPLRPRSAPGPPDEGPRRRDRGGTSSRSSCWSSKAIRCEVGRPDGPRHRPRHRDRGGRACGRVADLLPFAEAADAPLARLRGRPGRRGRLRRRHGGQQAPGEHGYLPVQPGVSTRWRSASRCPSASWTRCSLPGTRWC